MGIMILSLPVLWGTSSPPCTTTALEVLRTDKMSSSRTTIHNWCVDTANGVDVDIGDINGDGINDIIYYQENIRFVGETFVRPGNLTVLFGSCTDDVNSWSDTAITISNPIHISMEVGDINDDGNDDIILISRDTTGVQSIHSDIQRAGSKPDHQSTVDASSPDQWNLHQCHVGALGRNCPRWWYRHPNWRLR